MQTDQRLSQIESRIDAIQQWQTKKEAQEYTQKQEMITAVKKAMQEHVNGKIDNLDKKLTTHMTEIAPYIQALAGTKILYRGFLALGGVAVAWLAIKDAFPKL
jgi:RNA processing factor Prp31